jgi:DNA-binding MarR family transcriptional regulator
MVNGSSEASAAPQAFSDNEVMEPGFRMEVTSDQPVTGRNLFLRTYKLVDAATRTWHAAPEEDWPLFATIFQNTIIMKPVHVNPHAKRYLSPKNGCFETVVYVDDYGGGLPDDIQAVVAIMDARLGGDMFDPPNRGLGLSKHLAPIWQGLSKIEHAGILVISRHPEKQAKDGLVSIGTKEVDELRRSFNRLTTKGRKIIREAKHSYVYDDLLTRLDPQRFQRVTPPLFKARREGAKQTSYRERSERRSTVQTVRKQIDQLVAEAPHELMLLHAEIERVTLSKMIEAFKAKQARALPEAQWQAFFEQNKFVLSMAFARPVELTHTQFHARGSGLNGAGAQIGDFLFKELGQALAIVEIKTPETELVKGKAYRGTEVFGPTSELSGAVTQVLFQQSELRQHWFTHAHHNPSLGRSGSDAIKCVVVAGRLPDDSIKLRSFEVFRNACKDVDIITFDELLAKLEFLEAQLTPKLDEDLF